MRGRKALKVYREGRFKVYSCHDLLFREGLSGFVY